MKIYLCGQKHFGWETYRLLRSLGHEVVGVSAPAWKNEVLKLAQGGPDDLEDRLRFAARADGVPWLEAGQLRGATMPAGADLIVAAHSHDYLSAAVRNKTRLGAIGFHPSLLPLHRGRDAVRWAVRLHERVTGGSVYWFNDAVDGGPVAAREFCFIRPDDTAETLWRRELQPLGLRLFRRVLADLEAKVIVAIPQDEALATWEPSLAAPPLHRPDLPQIGLVAGFRTVLEDEDGFGRCRAAMYGIDVP